MDTDRLLSLAPHYVAMLLLVFLVTAVIEMVAGDLGFWVELVIVIAVVIAYRPVVTWLGIGPDEWG